MNTTGVSIIGNYPIITEIFPKEKGAVMGTAKLPFEDLAIGNRSLVYMHDLVSLSQMC